MSATMPLTAPAPAVRVARRPSASRRLVLACTAVGLLVIGAAIWSGVTYFESIDHLSRGSDPGSVEFAARSGGFVVYYEGGAEASLTDLGVTVTGPDGRPVRLEPFPYDLRYDVGKLVGHAVATVEVPSAGTYLVTANVGVGAGAGRLAVGADLGAATLTLVVAVIVALFTLGFGILLALVAVVTRPRRVRPALPEGSVREGSGW